MEITITGKGIDVTPAIRSYIESKLQKTNRIINDIMDVHVTLSVQKHLQLIDITVKTRNSIFQSHGKTTDMYASINEGLDSLLKQARRQYKKVRSHKGRKRVDINDVMEPLESEEEPEEVSGPVVRKERMSIKPLSLDEALLQLRGGDAPFLLFRNSTTLEINVLYFHKDGSFGLVETVQ